MSDERKTIELQPYMLPEEGNRIDLAVNRAIEANEGILTIKLPPGTWKIEGPMNWDNGRATLLGYPNLRFAGAIVTK